MTLPIFTNSNLQESEVLSTPLQLTGISGLKIIICGSQNDKRFAKKIRKISNLNFEIKDLTGKTSLSRLMEIIGNSRLLITNDTSAVHIGAATKTKTLVVGTGIFYGRFIPYPKDYSWINTIFPPFYFKKFHGPIFLVSFKSLLSILFR